MMRLDELMSEAEVYEKWPRLFVDKELRNARQARLIEWFNMRSGIYYTEAQLVAYLERKLQKSCEQSEALDVENKTASSKSGTNGSDKNKKPGLSIVTGMTKDESALVARALEQRT